MKNIKKLMAGLLVTTALFTTACGNDSEEKSVQNQNDTKAVAQAQSSSAVNQNVSENNKTLIVYFSYGENADLPDGVDASSRASIQLTDDGVVGNTGVIARMIQKDTNGEIISLKTAEKYSADYDEAVQAGKAEKESNARPALATHIDNIDNYDTIFVGYPNWWSDMPMAMYTFFEEYDLSGKKIIPFNTSGGSGLSNTVNEIKSLEPNATVEDGITISGNSVQSAQSQVDSWLKDLGYNN